MGNNRGFARLLKKAVVSNCDEKVYAGDGVRMPAKTNNCIFYLNDLRTNNYTGILCREKAMKFSREITSRSLPVYSGGAFQAGCGANPVFNHPTQSDLAGRRPAGAFRVRTRDVSYCLSGLTDQDNEQKNFQARIN